MSLQHRDIYERYLRLFDEKFGDLALGESVRNEGCLVRKLSYEEFSASWAEYKQLEDFLRESISAGHTLSDAVEYQYRELCAAVLQKPKDFKML